MKRNVYLLVFLMTPFLVMSQNNVKSQPDIQNQIDQLNGSLQTVKGQLNELKRTTQAQFLKMEPYAKKTEGWDSIHRQYDVWFTNTGTWISYLDMRDKAVRESLKKRKHFATYAAVASLAGALFVILLIWWLFHKKLARLRNNLENLTEELGGKIKKTEEANLELEKKVTESLINAEKKQDAFKSDMMIRLNTISVATKESGEALKSELTAKLTEMNGKTQQEMVSLKKELEAHHHDLFEKEIAALKTKIDQLSPKKQ
ncbi:MAG: hypothetical protein FJY10_09825 [Bacteroidetes bacterium]|nr:hypothetical protein [Bacteroidota bacterium]